MPEPRADDPVDLAYLRRLCMDVLQRTPTPAEVRSYVGAPVPMVVTRLLRSLEAMEQWLELQLYYFLLLDNFRPANVMARLPQQLTQGAATARTAIAEILLSTGFSLRNPGNDTFVTVVLEQCLALRVQDANVKATLEAGKQIYDGKRARFFAEIGDSQADVVRIVLNQPECTHQMLVRDHQRLLGEPMPAAAARTTTTRVHAEPKQFFTVLEEWLGSPAYRAQVARRRPRTHHQFIRALHNDLLGRTPGEDELRNMRNALLAMADPAPIRSVLAKVILDSGKTKLPVLERGAETGYVEECFRRYLGRAPGPDELQRFATIAAEPDTRAAHVVRALVSSVEYHYY